MLNHVDLSDGAIGTAFIAFVDHRDVLGSNMMGAISQDEEIFASREVHHVGAVRV